MKSKKHSFLHIATTDVEGDMMSSVADRWYWCSSCGTLSLNYVEYWEPPVLMVTSSKALPKGKRVMPDCK